MDNEKKLFRYDALIQRWLESPPKTQSHYKKFYRQIIDIHLGRDTDMLKQLDRIFEADLVRISNMEDGEKE